MAVILNDIYIGNTNGDTEADKVDFIDLFYKDNNKFEEIMNNQSRFIISGQKGTGKTILGRYIEKIASTKNISCKIINKNVITIQKLIESSTSHLSLDEFVHFFKWVILYEYSKCIVSEKIPFSKMSGNSFKEKLLNFINYKKNYNKIINFFDLRYQKGNFQFNKYSSESQLGSDIEMQNAIKTFKSKTSALLKENVQYERKPYYSVLPEVENWVLECLKYKNIIVIFDDLDELELRLNDDNETIKILLKLIDSIKDLN